MLRRIAYSITIALILFTPFIYSDELYNGVVSAKQIWFCGAMALLMLVAAFDLLFSRKPFTLQFNKIDLALLAFYTYYTIRAATTPYMPILHNQRWINWTLCVILYLIIKRIISNERIKNEELKIKNNEDGNVLQPQPEHPILNFSFLIINLLILSALVQSLWGLLQLYGYLPSFNSIFKITGTFFNPAPYALYLAVIFPLALGNVLFHEKMNNTEMREAQKGPSFLHNFISSLRYYLSLATVTTILLVLPATMIRAAWVGALIGTLVVLQFKYHYIQLLKQFLNTRIKKSLVILIAVVIVTLSGAGLFYLKKDSTSSKLFIWEVTIEKIAKKPLFGYGVGRFKAEYNYWQGEYFQKNPDEMNGPKAWVAGTTMYAFNEFLETLSEIGLIGLLLFLIVLLVICLEMRGERKDNIMLLFSFIFSFVTMMFISFPFYNLPSLVVFFLIMGIISASAKNLIAKPVFMFAKYFSVILLMGISITILINQFPKFKAYRNWQQANHVFKNKDYFNANKLFSANVSCLRYEGMFMQQYGKSKYMADSNTEALEMLKQACLLTTDYVLYCTLGDIYKAKKEYSNAENAYKFASLMIPNKLYPHYLLAKLYAVSGQHLKSIAKSREILAKIAKVNNLAVDEIKNEMKELLKEQEKKFYSNE